MGEPTELRDITEERPVRVTELTELQEEHLDINKEEQQPPMVQLCTLSLTVSSTCVPLMEQLIMDMEHIQHREEVTWEDSMEDHTGMVASTVLMGMEEPHMEDTRDMVVEIIEVTVVIMVAAMVHMEVIMAVVEVVAGEVMVVADGEAMEVMEDMEAGVKNKIKKCLYECFSKNQVAYCTCVCFSKCFIISIKSVEN